MAEGRDLGLLPGVIVCLANDTVVLTLTGSLTTTEELLVIVGASLEEALSGSSAGHILKHFHDLATLSKPMSLRLL